MLTKGEIYRSCATQLYGRKIKKVMKTKKSSSDISLPELLAKLKDFIEAEGTKSPNEMREAIARLMKNV